ncbi:MAG: hypothetical protein KGD63_13300 [Candidatus Lokiarchaeota archaeon]|nr:hypothetical protein [Candidatus Lokiarchaeota archaeon]
MLDRLNELFKSSTIKPTFDIVHIVLALFIFGKNPEGIGRYKLQKELMIGSGTTRSLIEKLNEIGNYISVTDKNKRKGHVLTEKGLEFLRTIKKKIPLLEKGDLKILEDIIVENKNIFAYFSLIKNVANKVNSGIEQRDAAIKVNGSGATCLIYDGHNLKLPSSPFLDNKYDLILNDNIQKYFKIRVSDNNAELENQDVIIIGLGDSYEKARLAALNSILTLI